MTPPPLKDADPVGAATLTHEFDRNTLLSVPTIVLINVLFPLPPLPEIVSSS